MECIQHFGKDVVAWVKTTNKKDEALLILTIFIVGVIILFCNTKDIPINPILSCVAVFCESVGMLRIVWDTMIMRLMIFIVMFLVILLFLLSLTALAEAATDVEPGALQQGMNPGRSVLYAVTAVCVVSVTGLAALAHMGNKIGAWLFFNKAGKWPCYGLLALTFLLLFISLVVSEVEGASNNPLTPAAEQGSVLRAMGPRGVLFFIAVSGFLFFLLLRGVWLPPRRSW